MFSVLYYFSKIGKMEHIKQEIICQNYCNYLLCTVSAEVWLLATLHNTLTLMRSKSTTVQYPNKSYLVVQSSIH